MKFEEAIGRLETIVHQLENGEPTLEASLALFEEGTRLAEQCRKHLDEAEGKIEVLMRQKNNKLKAEIFESSQNG
jgi:exodeoxyribonuclease VII small subunit